MCVQKVRMRKLQVRVPDQIQIAPFLDIQQRILPKINRWVKLPSD